MMPSLRAREGVSGLILAIVAAACLTFVPASASAGDFNTVWLCKPGKADNPCKTGLGTTLLSHSGKRKLGVKHPQADPSPDIDCFYVYPTVSDQDRTNANRDIDPELRSIALYQAARFSQECRVFAPVYRQVTIQGLFGGGFTDENREIAYRSARNAWRDYLENHNHGRGVVLIGHSQGTLVVRELIK